ncbi:hypothetical protein TNCV_3865251 [Trichonephila clavipes]|nr:hypothetical protein TNCV_3865251 [Trichonephila clavipes]
MAPRLARDLAAVSGRRNSRQTVYHRLVETDLYAGRPVWCVPLDSIQQERQIIVKLKASVVDTTRIAACSFQL